MLGFHLTTCHQSCCSYCSGADDLVLLQLAGPPSLGSLDRPSWRCRATSEREARKYFYSRFPPLHEARPLSAHVTVRPRRMTHCAHPPLSLLWAVAACIHQAGNQNQMRRDPSSIHGSGSLHPTIPLSLSLSHIIGAEDGWVASNQTNGERRLASPPPPPLGYTRRAQGRQGWERRGIGGAREAAAAGEDWS